MDKPNGQRTPDIGGKTEELVLHGAMRKVAAPCLNLIRRPIRPSCFGWRSSFGALYLLLSKVLLPKIANAIETRQGRIASDLSQAEQLNEDARKASEAYDAALADARAKANAIAQENRAEVLQELEAEQSKVDARTRRQACQGREADCLDPRKGHGRSRKHRRPTG
jgi:hypothetical protein